MSLLINTFHEKDLAHTSYVVISKVDTGDSFMVLKVNIVDKAGLELDST